MTQMAYFGPGEPQGPIGIKTVPNPWNSPLYQAPTDAGWSANVARSAPGASTGDVLSAGYDSNDPRQTALYERARAQSRAAAPLASDDEQRAVSLQGVQNPGYQYRPSESGVGGAWVYVGVGNERNQSAPIIPEPAGAKQAFQNSWTQMGASNPDAMGLQRNAAGWALDSNGNPIPGTQKVAPTVAQPPPSVPTSATVTNPDGTTRNLPAGTPLANGSFADGNGGTFTQSIGATGPAAKLQGIPADAHKGGNAPVSAPPSNPYLAAAQNGVDNGQSATAAALAGVGAPVRPPVIDTAAVQSVPGVVRSVNPRKSPFATPMNWGV